MKTKKTKVIALLLALVMTAVLFASCVETPSENTFIPPVDETPYVTELLISSPPIKTEYKAGQLFETAGMRLVAKWSHGVDEDLSPEECKQDPTGPLTAGTTEIMFIYEGVSCKQSITVSSVVITDVTFDFSSIGSIQLLGAIDLTDISVKAKYEDGSEDEITSGQYEMYEDEIKIEDPAYYNVTQGSHTITVKYGEYSDSFTFTALYGYNVSLNKIYTPEEATIQMSEKNSFLEKPENGGDYYLISGNQGMYIGEVGRGSVMRFHIYSEFETQAELVMNIASCRLLEGSWGAPKKMGEVQFNKVFDISVVEVDATTGMPELEDGNEIKTPIVMADDVILPASVSKSGDTKILENYVEISFGEITLVEGYNIIEVAVKDCEEYTDHENKVRSGNIAGFRVQALNNDEHEHMLIKQNGKTATCMHYGNEEYYRCSVCGRMFSDENAQTRIFNPILININPDAHVWDRDHADCMNDQVCTECGEIGETRTAHDFGGKDLCSYDGELECAVCHNTFIGGHVTVWDNGTLKCVQCNKELAYKIQAEDTDTVQYRNSDGTVKVPFTEETTDIGTGAVSKGAEGSHISSIESSQGWKGATMTIPVTVDTSGRFLFVIRAQANGSDGGSTAQTLSDSLSYCVNPEGDNPVYTPAGGKAVASSPTGGWKNMYRWGLTVIAEVKLNAGTNIVVLKFNEDGERAPNIDYFMFEKKGEISRPENEVITTRADGNEFVQGEGIEQDKLLTGVFMRIEVPTDYVAEFGATYYDAEITKEMCDAAGFDTSATGKYSVEFIVTMFGKEYKATFDYVVK